MNIKCPDGWLSCTYCGALIAPVAQFCAYCAGENKNFNKKLLERSVSSSGRSFEQHHAEIHAVVVEFHDAGFGVCMFCPHCGERQVWAQ